MAEAGEPVPFWDEVVSHALSSMNPWRPWARLPAGRLRALMARVDWPDILPSEEDQFEALFELSDDRTERIRGALPLSERVAFQQTYFDAVEGLIAALREAGPALPEGLRARDLAEYAVQRGVIDAAAAARLAGEPGLLTRAGCLVSFEDVLCRSLARAEQAEVEALLDPIAVRDSDDLPESSALGVVVHHPRFGLGVIVGADCSPRTLSVRFVDERRELTGEACQFRSARVAFVAAALALCRGRIGDMPEDAFFELIEPLGWGTRSTDRVALATALSARTTLRERLAAEGCFWSLRRRLRRRIEAWESESGQQIAAGDDSFGDLLSHVIGLGRAEVEANLAEPERALGRAERRDYQESFAYVLLGASERAERAEIEGLLHELAATDPEVTGRLREHPRFGLGLSAEHGGAVFWDREVEEEKRAELDALAGALADDPIVRPAQPSLETRLPVE